MIQFLSVPSVLWRCWLDGRKGIQPLKTEWWDAGVVICLEWGADLHMAQLMLLPLTVSCFSKIQIGFTFLVLAHPCSPGKRLLNGCVCSCQTSYLKVYETDLLQICRFGRTMAVDDQSEISFLIPQGTLPWQPVFVAFIHRTTYWMYFCGVVHRTGSLDTRAG